MVKKAGKILTIFLIIISFMISFDRALARDDKSNNLKNASKLASDIEKAKKAGLAKEKEMFNYFYKEGVSCYKKGDYALAIDNFNKALEINPQSKDVNNYIKKTRDKINAQSLRKDIEKSDQSRIKSYLREGRTYYSEGDYNKALGSFGDALSIDPENKDAADWTMRAERALLNKDARTEQKEIKKDLKVTKLEKDNVEQVRMLEVEKAYLPPEKPVKRKLEVEEVVTDETTKEEEAKKKMLEDLKTKIVPAVSLTDADIKDVIRQLMDMTGVTIVIDEKSLAEINQGAPLKLTFNTVSSMPLLDLLGIALKTSGLGYRVEPAYIWISTPAKLQEENLTTKTYKLKYGVRRIRKVELEKFETKSGSSQ